MAPLAEKTGLLLCNLGTPDSTSLSDIRKYLRQFLMDPYVIDIAYPLRWLLVNGPILMFRPKKTAHAYQQVWTAQGSPLLAISLEQKALVQNEVSRQGLNWSVELGMRYGKPSLRSALEKFKAQKITKIIYLPLYPQFALSSTTTAQVEIKKQLKALNYSPELKDGTYKPFHSQPDFINSWQAVIRETIDLTKIDHLLFSYHGLPERHIKKTESKPNHCLKPNCCDSVNENNQFCYRAHCYATTREIAKKLNLKSDQYSISFQSRLGRTPWIQPFTDFVIPELAKKGVKNLAVVSPSFVTDCLETLEELGIRAKDSFIQSGGKEFKAIPCLNTNPEWIKSIVQIAKGI